MNSTTYEAQVAARVEAAIAAADRSLVDLARQTGIPRVTLDRRLKGGTPGFNVGELKLIGDALGLAPADFVPVERVA